jgi:hypothetical protein
MPRRHLRSPPLLAIFASVAGLLWIAGPSIGVHLQRAHRREFLRALGLPASRSAVASDSALSTAVRAAVLPRVPLGSDTLAVEAFARSLPGSPQLQHTKRLESAAGDGQWLPRLEVAFPERARWYEFGVCDWERALAFGLDARGTVREIAVERIGSCI